MGRTDGLFEMTHASRLCHLDWIQCGAFGHAGRQEHTLAGTPYLFQNLRSTELRFIGLRKVDVWF